MKILIPANSAKGKQSLISNRFGRASFLTVYENNNYKTVENSATRAMGGAGVQTAQHVVNQNIDVLIAMNIGPKAWQVLSAANIELFEGISGSLEDNVKAYEDNKLKKISSATNAGGVYK
jgi:predicted Fe-Mo cluster-binding NifX family protein